MIGTPFISEDDVTQRKVDKINKKPWEQEVRDEKGRKRLHGAFTGGFSAGYFNTVGTKEGWTTSNFRSSRSEKLSTLKPTLKKQDVMDFMDEEDIKEQIGETTITSKDTHKDYLSSLNPIKSLEKQEDENQSFASSRVNINSSVREFIPQFNNMIGNMLMKESGYSDLDYQINSNVYLNFDTIDSKNMNKYYNGKLEFKDDYYGLGYIPLIEDDIFQSKKSDPTGANSKNIIRMDRFEDDNDYGYYASNGINDKEKYSFEILDENYLNDRERNLKLKRLRDNIDLNFEKMTQKFVKSEKKLHSVDNEEFIMPVLPKDYNPFESRNSLNNIEDKTFNLENEVSKLNPASSGNKTNNFSGKIDANKRAEILDTDLELDVNEQPLAQKSHNPFFQSKFQKVEVFNMNDLTKNKNLLYDLKSESDKHGNYNSSRNYPNNANNHADTNTLKASIVNDPKKAPSTVEQFNNYFHFKVDIPFKDDINKISRFAKFVAEKEGLIVGDSNYNNTNLMTATDAKVERNLFEILYKEELRLRKLAESQKAEIKNPHLSESDQLKERIEKIKSKEIKREKTLWRPEKVLCKRFKLKDPFENKINAVINSKFNNEAQSVSFKKGDVKYSMSNLQYELFKQEYSTCTSSRPKTNSSQDPVKDIKNVNNEKNVFEIVNSKPDINLFEEIFGD